MLTPGGTLGGRYRLSERIATGGMGDVWKAEDTVLGRTVAVKILQSALLEEPGFVERFRAEARVMATINHPGVVKVYDYGETDADGGGQMAYLVMEYVEGESLAHTLNRVGRLTPDRTLDLLAQAADALQAAHDHGIVHRDVKPGNLLVRPDGRLVLTDFGIARSAMSGQLTTAGSILGTASYVSPEQATGTGNITASSDVYSLGVVGYQCLSGHRPFEGENPIQVAMKHIREAPPPLPADVPGPVREVIDRAMAKDVPARWPSASAMADAARRAASGGGGLTTAAFGGATGGMRPPGPDRTSVMGGMPPTSGAGGYRAGAAAVPSGPPASGGPYQDYDYSGQTEPKRRKGLMIAGIVVAVLVVAVGLGAIGYALTSNDKNNQAHGGNSPSASASATKPKNAGGEIDLDSYVGQPYDQVAKDLQDRGLEVVQQTFARDGFEPGTVTRVRLPAGRNPPQDGDKVLVYVQPEGWNNGNGNGNGNGDNNGNGNGDGNGNGNMPTLPGGQSSSPSAGSEPSDSPTPQSPPPSDGGGDGNKARQSLFGGTGVEASQ